MPRLRTSALLLLLLLALLPVGSLAERPTTETLRVISCAPNLTEMMYELGLGHHLVGVSTFTNWPPEAAELPQVADLFNPNLEAMLRLNPTHVLGLESTTKVNDFFRRRPGVQVHTFGRIETLEEINNALLQLARVFDVEGRARAFLDAQPEPRDLRGDRDPVRVLYVLGYGAGLSQMYVIGRGTFLSELIELAGGVNVVPRELGIYPALNKEALLRLAPEVIVMNLGEEDAQARYRAVQREWRSLASLPAVRRGDFRFIADPRLGIPGPRALQTLPHFEKLLWETGPGGVVGSGPPREAD